MPYGSKHIPPDKLEAILADLQAHFGEPVRPVSEYCDAFREWHRAIGQKVQELLDQAQREGAVVASDNFSRAYELQQMREIKDALDRLVIPIAKSNYLWRLIYGDKLKRTKKCPAHQGRWSGYSLDRACDYGCNHGYDQTGWLPEVHEFVEKPEDVEPEYDENGKVVKMGVRYGARDQCYRCGGTLEKGQHVQPSS